MNFNEYLQLTKDIVKGQNTDEQYTNPELINYTKLNLSRMNRWYKHYQFDEKIKAILEDKNITKQHWIVITEPWCGDAAHIVPILFMMSKFNTQISFEIQLRDRAPFLIDNYLTNGGKSIPILVSRNDKGEDNFVWGPRPKGASQLFSELKANNADFETIKIALQKWYNEDDAQQIINEIIALLNTTN